jgi:site-specific recombinase XerC
MNSAASFPALLEAFFTDRLMRQRQASPHTIVSYRDTFRLLLQYAQQQLHKAPSALTWCAASPVLQGEVKSADGKAVLAFGFSAVSAAARCTAE